MLPNNCIFIHDMLLYSSKIIKEDSFMFLIDCAIVIFITLMLFTIKILCLISVKKFIFIYHFIVIPIVLLISFFKYRYLKSERKVIIFICKYFMSCMRYYFILRTVFINCFYWQYHLIYEINVISFVLRSIGPYLVIGILFFIEYNIKCQDDNLIKDMVLTLVAMLFIL